MNPLCVSSPARSPRPWTADVNSPPAPGASRQPVALRYRTVTQPPASPTRPSLPSRLQNLSSPNHNIAPRDRGVATPASSYTSRQPTSAEVQSRREDEEHASTQLILLLTLSVVLLTLPWVVDHPVTLLVPVALFILPITSGALRSLASEGFSLLFGGLRWFWRHRKAGKAAVAAQHQHAAPGSQRKPQSAAPHAYNQAGPVHSWQSTAASAYVNVHQPEPWHTAGAQPSHPATRSVDQHIRTHSSTMSNSAPPSHGAQPQARDWQPTLHRQPAIMQAQVVAPAAVGQVPIPAPELSTPDLDFDSDYNATSVQMSNNSHGRLHRTTPYPPPESHEPGQHQQGQCYDGYSFRHKQPDQTECTVYNWDEAEECTHRRGHRPLSDLLNNGQ